MFEVTTQIWVVVSWMFQFNRIVFTPLISLIRARLRFVKRISVYLLCLNPSIWVWLRVCVCTVCSGTARFRSGQAAGGSEGVDEPAEALHPDGWGSGRSVWAVENPQRDWRCESERLLMPPATAITDPLQGVGSLTMPAVFNPSLTGILSIRKVLGFVKIWHFYIWTRRFFMGFILSKSLLKLYKGFQVNNWIIKNDL